MIEILGGSIIDGEVDISGSKNAALPIICAALLTRGIVELKNVPDIEDIRVLYKILKTLNVKITVFKTRVIIDASEIKYNDLVSEDVKKIRGSSYLLSVMLFLFKKVKLAYPGGCSLGQRTLDFHIDACEFLGVSVNETNIIEASFTKLKGGSLGFTKKSVGASINTVILSGASKQAVKIYNYAKEPEVIHTIRFLRKIGYKIFEFKDYLLIAGHKKIKRRISYTIPFDRIEGQSFILLGTKARSLKVKNVEVKEMDSFFRLLDNMGAKYEIKGNDVTICQSQLKGADAVFLPYPALSTDIQPLVVPIMLDSLSSSRVEDKVYPTRFNYIQGLKAMHANINIEDTHIDVFPSTLEGAVVKGYDLRGVFALIIAASNAKGKTTILDGELAFRGYEDLIFKLNKIGIKASII